MGNDGCAWSRSDALLRCYHDTEWGVPGMIRSRRKVEALVKNAQAFLAMQQEFGSFHSWLWSFTRGRMLVYESHASAMPASNELSDRISAALKKRGFRYVGSITIYSMLQACGVINDHDPGCPRFSEVMRGIEVERPEA